MVTFFIESSALDSGNVNRKIYAAEELGYKIVNANSRPFGATQFDLINDVEGPVVAFGSLGMIRDFQKNNIKQFPFAWCDWKKMCCQTYYAYYGEYITQQKYIFIPFKELPRKKDFLYSTFGECIFIRPDENDKCFTGAVVKENMFNTWYTLAQVYSPPPETLCVVAERKNIEKEWRFIIGDGKVITGTLYCEHGSITMEEGYDNQAAEFAEKVAAIWQPHPIFVMDVALENGKYSVLEIGPVNGAGFYKCDIRSIIKKTAEIAIREYELWNTKTLE